ncbi:MAG: toll/interleukin-1 receptor domain-containing protein [Bacteroidota bacterium]
MESKYLKPKVFVSYSWAPSSNKQVVLDLCERLFSDGVTAILDIWDLKEGQDKYAFMESMVNDSEIKKVILICNEQYKLKADNRLGGVGSESMIISDKIYQSAKQEKFIPIVVEKDENGQPFLPTFVSSRIYIDLTSTDYYEDEYEKLLRNLFDRPSNRKPLLGKPPQHIFQEESDKSMTIGLLNTIKQDLRKESKYIQADIQRYLDTFTENLNYYLIDLSEIDKEFDDIIIEKIHQLLPIKNELTELFSLLIDYHEFYVEKIHDFLGRILEFIIDLEFQSEELPPDSYGRLQLDHYYFFANETFLSLSALLFRANRFTDLEVLIHKEYLVYSTVKDKAISLRYLSLNCYTKSINNIRINRLKLTLGSLTGKIIKERSNSTVPFINLQETDILLYYISVLNINRLKEVRFWIPYTSIYSLSKVPFTSMLASITYFDKIKGLFKVDDVDGLRTQLEEVERLHLDRIDRSIFHVQHISYVLDSTRLCKIN